MLTLADIDNLIPDSHAGSVYSDLYKDVFGSRPRRLIFESIADFDEQYARLVDMLNDNQVRDKIAKETNFANFIARIDEIRSTVHGCDYPRAVGILIYAEDKKKDVEFYGFESLEHELNIEYGSISQFLESKEVRVVLDVCSLS